MDKIESYKVVPEVKTARPQLNCDIASESGIRTSQGIYMRTIISKKSKTLGENIVMRLIERAEDEIIGKR